MPEEAPLVGTGGGFVPQGDGWFIVNVRDAAWFRNDSFGARTSGECLLIIEGEERPLRAWDFVHCPPGTTHAFVGAGDGPCVILMVGARSEEGTIVYPRNEVALKHGAGVEKETDQPRTAYSPFGHWSIGRPDDWDDLPWASGRESPRSG